MIKYYCKLSVNDVPNMLFILMVAKQKMEQEQEQDLSQKHAYTRNLPVQGL